MGTEIFNANIRTKMSTKPMTAPTRFFFAFSRVLLIRLRDLHPKEDAVDGADRDNDGNRRPEYGVEYLQYRLDHWIEIDVGQNNRVQIFSSFYICSDIFYLAIPIVVIVPIISYNSTDGGYIYVYRNKRSCRKMGNL